MWTVTVNSNVPIMASANSGRFSHNSSLIESGDVEKLLGSQSPIRVRSSSVRGRSAPSGHTTAHRATSPAPVRGRQYTNTVAAPQNSEDWKQQWTHALMSAVGEPVSHFIKDSNRTRPNNDHDVMKHQTAVFDKSNTKLGPRGPLKAVHDTSAPSQNSDSGISSPKGQFMSDDIKTSEAPRITRSRSLSRLSRSARGESTLSDQRPDFLNKSVQEAQNALDESESRRGVLMSKLRETQTALELQSERLRQIESAAKANGMLMEDLKLKEKEYRATISQLEASEEEKKILQIENIRLREEMQDRISNLEYQLKCLKSQHNIESTPSKYTTLIEHTTAALSLLEEENAKLQQDKEKLQSDLFQLKKILDSTKVRFTAIDNDNKNLTSESMKLKEDNARLSTKVQEMANQMMELRSLLQAVRDENERLFSNWKISTEDRTRATKQIEGYQNTVSDLKRQLSASSADRDRLFQEKLDSNSKLQQMMLEKETLMKSKLTLEDQLNEHVLHQACSEPSGVKYDVEETELTAVKRKTDELNKELTSVKKLYESALQQVAALTQEKAAWLSQHDLFDQERYQLRKEIDNLKQESTKLQGKFGNYITTAEYKKLQGEHGKLQTEYDKMKDEYATLAAKNQLFVFKYGQDGDMIEKERHEMIKWKKEKEAMQKEVALFQGQMLLMESNKKRTDEQINRLTSELEQIKTQSDFSSNNKSVHAEVSSLRQEVKDLKWQLENAEEKQRSQQRIIENLQEKNTEDVSLESQQMKDTMQELTRLMEHKDQTLAKLESELKFYKDHAEAKERAVQDLRDIVGKLERENRILCKDTRTISGSHEVESLQPGHHMLKRSRSVKTLKEELAEAVRVKQQDGLYNRNYNTSTDKFVDLLRSPGAPLVSQVPEKTTSEDSTSLHSVSDTHGSQREEDIFPQQVALDFSELLSESWSDAPRASMQHSGGKHSLLETSVCLPETQEEDRLSQVKPLNRPVKKLPPLPPPKLTPVPARTSVMCSQSDESTNSDDVTESSAVSGSSTASLSVTPSVSSASFSTGLTSSGLGQPQSSIEALGGSHRQKDLDVLIHKFDEMAAF